MALLISPYQYTTQIPIDYFGIKQTTIDLVGGIRCNICLLTYATKPSYDSHYRSHGTSSEIIYTCNICYKEIVGFPSFRGHCYTSHVIKDRYQCEHCSKQFSKISNLKDHVDKIHKFKCPTCRKHFTNKKEMLLHQIVHNGMEQPPYNCNTCKVEIETAEECKEHIEKHLKFLYYCPICNDHITVKENATDHMKTHFGDMLTNDKNEENLNNKSSGDTSEEFTGIMCQFCALILEDRVKFDAHFSCKHGDEDIVYMCVECGKRFEKFSIFKSHCNEHWEKNKNKCQVCNKTFLRLSMLAAHTVACQAAGAARGHKVFACAVCAHRFASMSRYREHLRAAHGLRSLPCPHDTCKRTFETPKQLILHQKSHVVTNQNSCSKCTLVFTSAAACERHMEVHRKKVFFCPICKRNAKHMKVIMKHIPTHFEAISHLCRICGRIFNSKRSLIQHLPTHKKIKSFTCTHCNKSFSKPSHLEQHINVHTGTKPYKCPICEKSFTNYPNCIKHIRRMHHQESIYLKNPVPDEKYGFKEDDAMETTADENDNTNANAKSNETFENDQLADDKRITNNNEDCSMIQENSYTNTPCNVNDVHKKKTIDMIISEAISGVDENSAMEIVADKNYEVSTNFIASANNIPISSKDQQIAHIELKIDGLNHNNSGIHLVNLIHVPTVTVQDKAFAMQVYYETENETPVQKAEVEQDSIAEDKSVNIPECSKPYKCPICEKTFAKYSYMSKHVSRVHHIRSTEIKHLIIDPKDGADDEGSAVDTVANDDNEVSTDNSKVDYDEQVVAHNTDKKMSNLDCDVDSKPYKCNLCDKTFAKHPYLTKHVRKMHDKKIVEIKSIVTDNSAGVDESFVFEKGNYGENDTIVNNKKEDIEEKFPNITIQNQSIKHHMPIDCKPHKCPMCEKSFAKYPYMTKHVRKVHNKKIVDIKKHNIDFKDNIEEEVSAMDTSADGENDISLDNIREDNIVQILSTGKQNPNAEQHTSDPKRFKCPTCEKSFAKPSYMSKHIRTVHNKKIVDNKNSNTDHKDGVDDDASPMERVVDEENDISTDHSKDENDEQGFSTDQQIMIKEQYLDMNYKPYKCPMCDKYFAQDRYCRNHVRRVHYKNSIDIKSPIYDRSRSNAIETSIEDQNISKSNDFLINDISNIDSIANIVNQPESPDCLSDIDDANASIDFANVKLENYIFSVQRDGPIDIVPSIPEGKYLLNENSDGTIVQNDTTSISNDLLYTRSVANAPIVSELFNENGEAINVVEKDLFNANKEGGAIGEHLYNGNREENDNPIDILEYIAEMPENNSLFVPVASQGALAPSAPPSFPCEYGPEFSGGAGGAAGALLGLDDHDLPHIDPMLTIAGPPCVPLTHAHARAPDAAVLDATHFLALDDAYDYVTAPAWDPPVITKLCDQYAYGCGEMPEASRVPIMNTDIF